MHPNIYLKYQLNRIALLFGYDETMIMVFEHQLREADWMREEYRRFEKLQVRLIILEEKLQDSKTVGVGLQSMIIFYAARYLEKIQNLN
jgi:hypothetical protein